MDNYNLILAKNDGKKYGITKLISNLAWEDDIETLGTKLSFEFARNKEDSQIAKLDIVEIGDKIILENGTKEIFRGIITNLDPGRYKKNVTCFDYAFYLNQSKTVKQFYKISASKAIQELCGIFGVPIGKIDTMNTKISKIYKDKTIAEIIKDILEQATKETGTKYRLEMREGKIYVIKYVEISIVPTYQPSENQAEFNVFKAIGEPSISESIQDMKNSIIVTSDNEKDDKIKANQKDQTSINKFGLLQDIITVDKKNSSQASNIAKNKLKELNKVNKEISISVLGNDNLRAGRVINITNNLFNLKGKYLIKSSSHTYNNLIHKCTINLTEA